MVVTASTCPQVSPPKAPAFIASAPPSVPGMPAKNSAGPSPHLMHCRAMRAQATPASARTVLSPVRARRSSAPCVLTTTPFKPPSRTRRLLPSPIQWMGTAGGGELLDLLDEQRLEHAAAAHRAADGAAVGAGDRGLARRVHLGHGQRVRPREHLAEIVDQVAGAGVAVRLEGEQHAPTRVGLAHR